MTTLHPTLQEHLNREIRRAQAQALREAAATIEMIGSDSSYRDDERVTDTWLTAATHLRARADRIEGRLDVIA